MKPPTIFDLLIIVHLLGVSISFGGAVATDLTFFYAIKQKVLEKHLLAIIAQISKLIWIGAGLVILSGVGLFFQAPEYFLKNQQFLAKITIVIIVLLNGLFFHLYHLPFLKKLVGKTPKMISSYPRHKNLLLISGVFSSTSWFSALILGSTLSKAWPYGLIMALYLGVIVFGASLTLSLKNKLIPQA